MSGKNAKKFSKKQRRAAMRAGNRKTVDDVTLQLWAPSIVEVIKPPECKHKYIDVGAANVTSAGTVSDLFAPSQGVASNQRVSDSVRIRGMRIRIKAYCLNANVQSTIRFVCFLWRVDSTLLVPGVTQVLNVPALAADTVVAAINSNTVSANEIVVLFDVLGGVSNGGPGVWHFDWVKKFDSNVEFEPAAITGLGKPFILAISDAAVNVPVVSIGGAVYFDDA